MRIISNTRAATVVKAAVALSLAAASTAVLSMPIPAFDVQTRSGFLPDDGSFGTGVTNPEGFQSFGLQEQTPGEFDGAWRRLEWGTDVEGDPADPPSALQVINRGLPSDFPNDKVIVNTNGPEEEIGRIRHENNPIFGSTLVDATLVTQLQINNSPFGPQAGDDFQAVDALTFFIGFNESVNDPDSGTCANGLPRNGANNNSNGCADIFVVENAESLGFNDDLEIVRELAGIGDGSFAYQAIVTIEGLDFLGDASCIAAGAGTGCIGFETPEAQTTVVSTNLRIEATAVPAPATLAVLGVGLLALARRQRNRS